jgi:hypothetical protein
VHTGGLFERFTDRARRVLVLAQEEARRLNHGFIGTEHILLGLIHEGEGVAAKVLESFGISLEAVRDQVRETIGPSSAAESLTGSPPFTPRSKKVLELSLREALQLGHNYIGTEHILLGLVREGQGVAAQVLVTMGVDLGGVRDQVIQMLSGPRVVNLAAVDGDLVEKTEIPLGAAVLLTWNDASVVLVASATVAQAVILRSEVDGVVYETCTYRPGPLPEISVSVAGAIVTRDAFDDYARRLDDVEDVGGLGDAAVFSASRGSLRVLAGSTVFLVQVRQHPQPREAAIAVAERALANLARELPPTPG